MTLKTPIDYSNRTYLANAERPGRQNTGLLGLMPPKADEKACWKQRVLVYIVCTGRISRMASVHTRKARKLKRLNIRATERQEKLIRTGAETRGVSVTDFILESACLQAEHILADR